MMSVHDWSEDVSQQLDRGEQSSNLENVIGAEGNQYSDLFKLVTNHHEEYCKLLDAENQQHEELWFDDLDQDVFNFKHRVHSWLKEAAQKSSRGSRCSSSSKRSSSSRSSASHKSSGSSRSSTKLKLL